jgi:hypothetical protein
MTDRPAWRQSEIDARKLVVSLAEDMLAGRLSFLEGASRMFGLERDVGGVTFPDSDFTAFDAIVSETDHLPLERVKPLWQPEAIAKMEPEYKQKEEWARSFASQACRNLIKRFKSTTQ